MKTRFSTAAGWPQASGSGRLLLLVILGTLAVSLCGCGGGSGSSTKAPTSPASGSPVLVGTAPGSLPTPAAQSNVNRYAGIDISTGGTNWTWRISQPDHSYNYQQQQGVAQGGSGITSSGEFSNTADYEYLSDTISAPYTLSGLNVESKSGVAIFEQAYGGFPTGPLIVGVPEQETGCLAPDGTLAFNYLVVPSITPVAYRASDALYGNATLTYGNGKFTYGSTTQMATGGVAASTSLIPFNDSSCVQALAGYGIQSVYVTVPRQGRQNILTYIGASGQMVSAVSKQSPDGTSTISSGFVSMVQPASAVDLSAVTKATYRGYYSPRSGASQYADPAYFGASSKYVTSPVFTGSSTTLVGGYEDFFSLIFTNPVPQVTGNLQLDFGAQDSNHSGLFSKATLTEPDPNLLCKAAQQTVRSDGQTYCTFPVVALVGQSYGKFIIYVAGPEPTTGAALFYALVQD